MRERARALRGRGRIFGFILAAALSAATFPTASALAQPVSFEKGTCHHVIPGGPWTDHKGTVLFGQFWHAVYRIGPDAAYERDFVCQVLAHNVVRNVTLGRTPPHHGPLPDLTFTFRVPIVPFDITGVKFKCYWYTKNGGACKVHSVRDLGGYWQTVSSSSPLYEGFAWYPAPRNLVTGGFL